MSNTLDEILDKFSQSRIPKESRLADVEPLSFGDAKQQIQALITDKLLDKLYELMDEAEDGHPDGCDNVHTHNIEAHIAELIKENN